MISGHKGPKTVMRYDHGRENHDQNAMNFLNYDNRTLGAMVPKSCQRPVRFSIHSTSGRRTDPYLSIAIPRYPRWVAARTRSGSSSTNKHSDGASPNPSLPAQYIRGSGLRRPINSETTNTSKN